MEQSSLQSRAHLTIESKDMNEFERFLKEYELDRLHTDFLNRWVTLIIASLSLITALAWDDLFKYMFVALFGHMTEVSQKALYSIILTLVTILITVLLSKIFIKKGEKEIRRNHTHETTR